MIRLDAVRERIAEKVAELPASRLLNAADFTNLVDNNQLPQVTPAAFVMFGGLLGREADAVTGLYRQNFEEGVSVVLFTRVANNPLQDQALADITPLVREIVTAICGWAPSDAIGVFVLRQAELVGAKGGALVFQIDFALNDQLRITT